ncbi:GDSL-type esterase/lipase family protein [Paenibacillus sp. TAF58]
MENRGMGWDKSGYMKERFEADVIQLRPHYVIIMIGINNTWELDAEQSHEYKEQERIETEITDDIKDVIRRSLQANIQPIICSLLPTCNDIPSMALRNKLICSINKRLHNMTAEFELIYVDYHGALCEPDGLTLKSKTTYDGVHPDVYGYDVMTETLRIAMRRGGIDL